MIVLLVMMTAISASLRLFPFLFAKWLSRWTVLEKLAHTLPLCISILLVAHLLEPVSVTQYPFAIPEAAGLVAVAAIQVLLRNLLFSMCAGVCIHQLLLHYL